LRDIPKERQQIRARLEKPVQENWCEVVPESDAPLKRVREGVVKKLGELANEFVANLPDLE
jgi:hypothetical protein